MPLQRWTMIFNVTTNPVVAADAIAHQGGWSEGHWDSSSALLNDAKFLAVAQKRALMLPVEAAIIGFRMQQFTINRNKLIPGGTSSFKVRYPGSAGLHVNVPQDAMQFSAAMTGQPQGVRFVTRCLPDEVIERGEFNGNAAYKTKMTNFVSALLAAQLGSMCHDLTTYPNVPVQSLSLLGLLKASGLGGALSFNYLRFRRIINSTTNEAIRGSFMIESQPDANSAQLSGLPAGAVAGAGGSVRLDFIDFTRYAAINFDRVLVKKVGGPLSKYRGRQSKR